MPCHVARQPQCTCGLALASPQLQSCTIWSSRARIALGSRQIDGLSPHHVFLHFLQGLAQNKEGSPVSTEVLSEDAASLRNYIRRTVFRSLMAAKTSRANRTDGPHPCPQRFMLELFEHFQGSVEKTKDSTTPSGKVDVRIVWQSELGHGLEAFLDLGSLGLNGAAAGAVVQKRSTAEFAVCPMLRIVSSHKGTSKLDGIAEYSLVFDVAYVNGVREILWDEVYSKWPQRYVLSTKVNPRPFPPSAFPTPLPPSLSCDVAMHRAAPWSVYTNQRSVTHDSARRRTCPPPYLGGFSAKLSDCPHDVRDSLSPFQAASRRGGRRNTHCSFPPSLRCRRWRSRR